MKKYAKKIVFSLQVFLALILVSFSAIAAEGAHHETPKIDGHFWAIVADFILLVLALYILLKKQAREFFATRSLKIKLFLDDSKKLYNEAHARFTEIENKLKNVETEGRALIRSVSEQAEQERKRLVVQAREMSEKIKQDAQRIAEVEVTKARVELRGEAVELAAQLAQQKIKTELTPDDQIRLGLEFVGQVKKAVQS